MEDPRCKIVAIEMDDLRCMSPLNGVVIEIEDLRCKSLLNRVVKGFHTGPGPIEGHEKGLDLSPDDKRALIAFLKTL
jgi:hypothetical protein